MENQEKFIWRLSIKLVPIIVIIYVIKPCFLGLWAFIHPDSFMNYMYPDAKYINFFIYPTTYALHKFTFYSLIIGNAIAALKKKVWAYYTLKWIMLLALFILIPMYHFEISKLLERREYLLDSILPHSFTVMWSEIYIPLMYNFFCLILSIVCPIIWFTKPIKRQFIGYSKLSRIEDFFMFRKDNEK